MKTTVYLLALLLTVFLLIPVFFGWNWWLFSCQILLLLFIFIYFIYWIKELLATLNKNVNELLKFDRTDNICEEAVTDFVKVFGADYAVISRIDFLSREIISQNWSDWEKEGYPSRTLGEASPKKWISDSRYPLDPKNPKSNDIIVKVLELGKVVKVINNKIINTPTISEDCLNDTIKEIHKKFARVYFPIIYKSNNQDDIILGVVELGFKNRINTYFSLARFIRYISLFSEYRKWLSPLSLIIKKISEMFDIELYLSVFAQQYYRLLVKKLTEQAEEHLFKKEGRELEDQNEPKLYLQKGLNRICEFVGGKYGLVVFRNSFNYDAEQMSVIPFGYDTIFAGDISVNDVVEPFKTGSKDPNTKSITRYVLTEGKPYFSNNIESPNEKYYLKSLNKSDIVSEIAIPLRKSGNTSGVLFLNSSQLNYYNTIHAQILESMTRRLMPEYYRKKRYYVYQKLSKPSNVWDKTETLYRATTDLLKEYFDCDSIAVWEREPLTEKSFKLCTASCTQAIQELYTEENLLRTDQLPYKTGDPNIKILTCDPVKKTRFAKVCEKAGFKSYILLSVVLQDKYEVFFNILSHTKTADCSKRDEEFLDQIAQKTSGSLQSIKLVKSFSVITETLNQSNGHEVLKKMIENALRVTNSDIVSFFPYKNRDILIKDSILIGFTAESQIEGKAKLANLIIEKGTQWISSQTDYEKFLEENKIKETNELTKKSFRFKNKIQSTAAIRIEHEGLEIGVIFFNYKNAINFEERNNLKLLITNFSAFFGFHLLNKGILDEKITEAKGLQKQRDYVVTEYLKKLQELEQKQKELQEIEIQFADILPRATRTSFYQILEGINHHVKQSLFDIHLSLRKIDTHSPRLTKDEREHISLSIKEVNENYKTVVNLLKLFDFKTQEVKNLDINELIKMVIDFFKVNKYKTVSFKMNFSEPQLYIKVNKSEFTMIFYNIIHNSLQALSEKRQIMPIFEGEIVVTTLTKNGIFTLIFEDNGVGINNDKKQDIFERGFTTKKTGTGIGLYFIREILKNEYNGSITCDSRKGYWTRFTIEVPEYINYQ